MKPWKMEAPETPKAYREGIPLQEAAKEALKTGGDVQCMRFAQDELSGVVGGILDFSECRFERCTFGALELKRMGFIDCVFEQCEISNQRFADTGFRRVCFRGCRMTGVEFLNGALTDVQFEQCALDYLAMGDSKLERVAFQNCPMWESQWTNVRLGAVALRDSDLTASQWDNTPMKGLDGTTCKLDGIRVSLYDLRGLKVTEIQALSLAGLLGIEIVPDDLPSVH